MGRYIELNAGEFFAFLEGCGFSRLPNVGSEVVFGRQHHKNPNTLVKVYTSIREGDTVGRAVGKDAIRVVAIGFNTTRSWGLWKGPRVYRTGSQEAVQARTLSRMREAYDHLNKVASR